jgi:hypothetical protein
MSIGPTGFYSVIAPTSPQASALAAPLAQTQGSDVDRTAQEVAEQSRETDADTKAETAAGVGATDGEEHGSNERDADGRRLWEKPLRTSENASEEKQPADDSDDDASDDDASEMEHPSKDASGERGGQLDLMG